MKFIDTTTHLPTVKIKSWRIRLEINFHDLWFGLFIPVSTDMYFGGPILIMHLWKEEYGNNG